MKPLSVVKDLYDDEFDDDLALDAAVLAFFRDEVARPTSQDNITAVQRIAQAMRHGVARADAADTAEAEKKKKEKKKARSHASAINMRTDVE